MKFTIYTASDRGNLKNCLYPNKVMVVGEEDLKKAFLFDHVTANYKNNYRSKENFIKADVIPMDCDNDHSDDEKEWVTPLEVALAFPDVTFAICYSRNHMKVKGNKTKRPRFHVYFPINEVTDADQYVGIKEQLLCEFSFFDSNAIDSARLLFGTENPEVEIYSGSKLITDYLEEKMFADWENQQEEVSEGSRNNTMSHIAGKLIKRYGNCEGSHSIFLKVAEKCTPPLEDEELSSIWNSAVNFGKKVSTQAGYISPELYNADLQYKPLDFSDVGQAIVLAREYGDTLRYSPSTDYIVFNGSYWEESKPKAQGVTQNLTENQLEEADGEMKIRMQEIIKNGAFQLVENIGEKKAKESFNKEQAHSFELYENALNYKKYAIKRRDSKYITSCLKEARPLLEIEQKVLDANEFLLNTPNGTYDLRKGIKGLFEHKASDLITKQTNVSADEMGREAWEESLNVFFQRDKDLIEYVQKIVGLAAIGKVYVEALIISYGEGRNGKSTFWNAISRVLGSYSGNISADVLTAGCKRNVKPELAEAKGKRLLIAAELEEGMRLNTSNVKQLCSTDEIYAEKKYKDPFSYVPSHTLVLYTNHLPRVGAIDKGTWRRLIVIPFGAKIEGNNNIKNYADYLFHNAGGAILTWIIEGAKKVIDDKYKIKIPKKVEDAIKEYKENNDWFAHFLEDCCQVGDGLIEKSGEVYSEYRAYCLRTGEFVRGTADFYSALETSGFSRYRTRNGRFIKGLKLKSEFIE
ncbi:MAG: phage/plasmid primase, P4 family [Anaerovoracaceae bacterium]